MAFLFVQPKHIEEVLDENGKIKTLRLNCSELSPRNFNVNLIKQPVSVRNELQGYVDAGQPIMIPLKEGRTSDGQVYFQLEAGQIIPVSSEFARSLNNTPVPTSKVVELPHDDKQPEKTADKKQHSFG
jgi:hypothetical protein